MKDPLDRTKVVLRHLPPSISQAVLMEQVNSRFTGRYRWTAFRPGKTSHKNSRYALAYIDFRRAEDVLEFAEFFDGHVFVNEKGAQFKTIVEYAPSQRVPKSWSKKDGREGTILKDPEYLEFLEMLRKPTENLPSAEIQLERREAERAGGTKEALIVTPLMEFVRQKRAAKNGSQRISSNGKLGRRAGGVSTTTSTPASHKKGSEKRRISTPMYILRDNTKVTSGKDKSNYIVVARKDEPLEKSGAVPVVAGSELLEDESGASGHMETGKKKVLLLKGKEREVSHGPSGVSQSTVTFQIKNSSGSTSFKQSHTRVISGSVIKSILSKKEVREHLQQPASVQAEEQMQTLHTGKDKRPPRPTRSVSKDHFSSSAPSASLLESDTKRSLDEKTAGSDAHALSPSNDKPERRTRNKERPDRGVWAPLRRSDALQAADDSLTSSGLPSHVPTESVGMQVSKQVVTSKYGDSGLEAVDGMIASQSFHTVKPRGQDAGIQNVRVGRAASPSPDLSLDQGEKKFDSAGTSWSGEPKVQGSGRISGVSMENGSHKHSRRGPTAGSKEADNSASPLDGKSSKRGPPGYGTHEKQIWVQKSGSGS